MPAMQRTVVTLTAGQAAGTDPILPANLNRTTLVAGNATATAARLDVAAVGAGEGMPLPAGGIVGFGQRGGPTCPTDALYVGGLAETDKLTIWEA